MRRVGIAMAVICVGVLLLPATVAAQASIAGLAQDASGGVLPGVSGGDPFTYAVVVALLAGAAFMASYVPARRATRVDPSVALRAD